MTHPALKTRATELFGVQYPIVQTGMGWVSDAKLTAATANAGGLGIISAGLLNYAELARAISDVQDLTDKPFGVNLRADSPDIGKFVELLIRAKVKVASFALAPKQDLIGRLKDGGVVVIRPSGPVATPRRSRPGVPTQCWCRAVRAVATPVTSPPACCCPRWWTRWTFR